jgi:DNA (cytosine-5)-methyltransferase 1
MNKYLDFLQQIDNTNIPKNIIKIGTDCSGVDCPIQALKLLNIPFKHVFSCDNDKYSKINILHNFSPDIFYDNIQTRDHSNLPKIDIYFCGFPCQTFSTLGGRAGFSDKIKGTIFFECVKTIISTIPKIFVFENVKGLLSHDDGKTFDIILETLDKLSIYNIYYKILNTIDYGIPQWRERVYIIGIIKTLDKGFSFPNPIKQKLKILDLLDDIEPIDSYYYDLTEHKKDILDQLVKNNKINDLNNSWLVNLNVSNYLRTSAMLNICPTLLAGNGGDCIYYLTSHKRRLTTTEYMRLQGFDPKFKSIVSRSQTYKQIGNGMSVNIICFILNSIFNCVDL